MTDTVPQILGITAVVFSLITTAIAVVLQNVDMHEDDEEFLTGAGIAMGLSSLGLIVAAIVVWMIIHIKVV